MADKNEQIKVTGDKVLLDPATQSILGKYGIRLSDSKPVLVDQGVTVKENNIVINNNVTNNTTINITPPPTIPQARPLQFKEVKNSGLENTKTWIKRVYERQEKESKDRYEEYKNRDLSLSRSANRLLRKLDEIMSNVGAKLNPSKIGSDANSQLKTLIFLFGLHALSTWWDDILEKVASIEESVKSILAWCGIGGDQEGKSGLHKSIVKILGGKENEDAWTAFKELFIGDSGLFTLLGKEIKLFLKERSDCVKLIQFPKLAGDSGLIGILKGLGIYLKNILGAIIGGVSFTEDSLTSGIRRDAAIVAQEGKGWKSLSKRFSAETKGVYVAGTKEEIDDTSWGDLTLEAHNGKDGKNKQNTLDFWDVDLEGRLVNNTTSSIKQSRAINGMLRDYESGVVNTTAIISGFENLIDRSRIDGGVLVDKDFLKRVCEIFEIPEVEFPEGSIRKYKYIRVPKTQEDYDHEGASVGKDVGVTYLTRSLVESAKKTAGADGFWGDMVDAGLTGSVIQDPGKAALWKGVKSGARYIVSDDYTLKLVPESDPRPGVEYDGKTTFEYSLLKEKTIRDLEKYIGIKIGLTSFSFDNTSKESVETLTAAMIPKIQAGMAAKQKEFSEYSAALDNDDSFGQAYRNSVSANQISKFTNLKADWEVRGYGDIYDKIGTLRETIRQDREDLDKEWEESRVAASINNIKDLISYTIDYASDAFGFTDYSGSDLLASVVGKEDYHVTSGFGADRAWNRDKPTKERARRTGNPWLLRHQGVDLRAKVGTPIYASMSGKVVSVNPSPSGTSGRSVQVVTDDGLYKYYACHLSSLSVSKGQHVEAGQLLGKSGASGHGKNDHYAPHIHFQVGYVDTSVSPLTNGWVDPATFNPPGVVYGNFERTTTKESQIPEFIALPKEEPMVDEVETKERGLARDIVNKSGLSADLALFGNWRIFSKSPDIPDFKNTNDKVEVTQAKLAYWSDKSAMLVWNPGNIPSIVQPKIDEKTDFIASNFFPEFQKEYMDGKKLLKESFLDLGDKIIKYRDIKAETLIARANVVDAINRYNLSRPRTLFDYTVNYDENGWNGMFAPKKDGNFDPNTPQWPHGFDLLSYNDNQVSDQDQGPV